MILSEMIAPLLWLCLLAFVAIIMRYIHRLQQKIAEINAWQDDQYVVAKNHHERLQLIEGMIDDAQDAIPYEDAA
jgi:hypothetical protein